MKNAQKKIIILSFWLLKVLFLIITYFFCHRSHISFFSKTLLILLNGVRNRQHRASTSCNENYISAYPGNLWIRFTDIPRELITLQVTITAWMTPPVALDGHFFCPEPKLPTEGYRQGVILRKHLLS